MTKFWFIMISVIGGMFILMKIVGKHVLMQYLVKSNNVRMRRVNHLKLVLLFVAILARNGIMMLVKKLRKKIILINQNKVIYFIRKSSLPSIRLPILSLLR